MSRDDETPIQTGPLPQQADRKADPQSACNPPVDPPVAEENSLPTIAQRFLTWAKALAILLGAAGTLGLALVGIWKGGDAQDQGDAIWKKLRKAVNAQGVVIRKLHLRVVAFQARQEGETSATLQAKLQALQQRHDTLRLEMKAQAPGGRRARLVALQKDLELERIRRVRLEERLKLQRAMAKRRGALPPAIKALPKSWRKGAK